MIFFWIGLVTAVIFGVWLGIGDPGVGDPDEDQEWDSIDYPRKS